MTPKLILIVLDGLNAETAFAHLGFMNHLMEQKHLAAYTVHGELPCMSRPMYETIQTGLPVVKHGIYNNATCRLSKEEHLFSLARRQGRSTAAAAYYWVSELYNKAPFDHVEDRFQIDTNNNIENGIFYYEDGYPDSHLFADAHRLVRFAAPDYLLVHPMNVDDAGHGHGSESAEYIHAASKQDVCLSTYIPKWLEAGYQIVVTSDHGMNEHRSHNGGADGERRLPLYILSDRVQYGDFRNHILSELEIAPLCAALLQIEPSQVMIEPTIEWKE